MQVLPKNLESMREQLAAIEHEGWAAWQKDLHEQCIVQTDGSLMIPSKLVAQLQKQMSASYASLSEEEKEADRRQVDRYLPLVQSSLE